MATVMTGVRAVVKGWSGALEVMGGAVYSSRPSGVMSRARHGLQVGRTRWQRPRERL